MWIASLVAVVVIAVTVVVALEVCKTLLTITGFCSCSFLVCVWFIGSSSLILFSLFFLSLITKLQWLSYARPHPRQPRWLLLLLKDILSLCLSLVLLSWYCLCQKHFVFSPHPYCLLRFGAALRYVVVVVVAVCECMCADLRPVHSMWEISPAPMWESQDCCLDSFSFAKFLWGIFLNDLGQKSLSPVSQWWSLSPIGMPSYCSSSDFLQSHYTVLLSSFLEPFSCTSERAPSVTAFQRNKRCPTQSPELL